MSNYNLSFKTKNVALIAVLAALYAAINYMFAPISYGPLQFRIADALQPFVLKHKKFIYAIALGTFFANMFGGFGILDWGMMPIISLIAGHVAYRLQVVNRYLAMFVFAVMIGAGVGFMLNVTANVPFIYGFAEVATTVTILNFIGITIVDKIYNACVARGVFIDD